MSELQNDETIIDGNESVDIENQEDNGSDLATDSEVEHEEQPQVDEEAKKQAAIQKVINEKTFKAKQAEREAQEYKAKLESYEAKQREQEAAQYASVPDVPDPFDDDYEEKIVARDKALLAKAQFDAQNQYYLQQQQSQQQQDAQAKATKIQQSFTSYAKKAAELGINQNELVAIGDTVGKYGLSLELQTYILDDPDGPLIAKHLANSPNDGFELANMSPYDVGTFLNNIKTKAGALKPKTSTAPKPATHLQGGSLNPDNNKYQNIKGAKFE